MRHHEISDKILTLETLNSILSENKTLRLSKSAKNKIQECRDYLEKKTQQPDALMYGINTGFGSLCNIRISDQDIEQLQYNLVVSHSVGVGDFVPIEIVRIMLLLKIQSLSYGNSAVRLELVERLVEFYNKGIFPVIYELGSLGASGDLAPLAHLSLPLIGLGEVWYKGKKYASEEILAQKGIKPLRFQAKEALALLNGTQFSTGYAVWNLLEANRLAQIANINAATAIDAFDCRLTPFHDLIHQIRPHLGQLFVSTTIRNLLQDSEISATEKKHVQDPYSFRCVPQVHGASYDAFDYITQTILIEINSVTDNPNVFAEEDLILSGGNFHAQPIALTMDHLAIALSEFGNISERRVFQLISGQRGLPPFLTKNPGLHSGMMIAQYTAAAIVNQNKTYCTPSSADSIVSCNGQEDHVSMAANAATKARKIALNVERLLAIEFMVAMQALEFRRPLRSSAYIESLFDGYRLVVPKLEDDRILSTDIEKTIGYLRTLKL
jgi:histidine ammonia-lyase